MALSLVVALDALVLMGRRVDVAQAVARLRHALNFDIDVEVREGWEGEGGTWACGRVTG